MSDDALIHLPLERVRPDPAQPRRWLPLDLARAYATGTSAPEILRALRARAARNKYLRARLRDLDALANSIAQDGLLQPIRVWRDGAEGAPTYIIEAGERRFWAHVVLLHERGDARFQHIGALVVDAPTVALRARVAENFFRSDLTAIELARAFAGRVDELTRMKGIARRVAEQIAGAEFGLSDRRVRQFTALLTLALETQELAQQAGLSENALRALIHLKDPQKQLAAVRALLTQPAVDNKTKNAGKRKNVPAETRPRPVARVVKKRRVSPRKKPVCVRAGRKLGADLGRAVRHFRDLLERRLREKGARGSEWQNADLRRAARHLHDLLERALGKDATR